MKTTTLPTLDKKRKPYIKPQIEPVNLFIDEVIPGRKNKNRKPISPNRDDSQVPQPINWIHVYRLTSQVLNTNKIDNS